MDVCMCIKTPVGDLLAVDSQGALTQLVFGCQPPPGRKDASGFSSSDAQGCGACRHK